MTSRRDILAAIGAGCLGPLVARAQSAARKPFKVAWFSGGTLGEQKVYVDAFRDGMRALGYVEGRDFTLEYFWRGETIKPFSWMAHDVVGAKPDFIMATCEVTASAAKKATSSIPIVLTASTDPVANGIVANLARPGGNVTGISSSLLDTSLKRIELLKELIPGADRVLALRWRYEQVQPNEFKVIEEVARKAGMTLTSVEVEDAADFERAFAEARKAKLSGLLDMAGLAWTFPYVGLLGELEVKYKLPAVHFMREVVEKGGLISYGPVIADGFRRSAKYVDRITRGARAGDLSIEQPERFETCVNLATARALGITVPQSILLRADRVVG